MINIPWFLHLNWWYTTNYNSNNSNNTNNNNYNKINNINPNKNSFFSSSNSSNNIPSIKMCLKMIIKQELLLILKIK